MKTMSRTEREESTSTPDIERYGIAAINFAAIVSRKRISEDEYTASLVDFLGQYSSHFQQRRARELSSAGMIIRQDIDALTGVSCPATVDEVGSVFANFIQDEPGRLLARTPGCNPIGRAAILTMLHCIDQYPTPRVIEN